MAFPSVTYTFANSTTADATQVNQNFTDLVNGLSDGTKDINVAQVTAAGKFTASAAVVTSGTSTVVATNASSSTVADTTSVVILAPAATIASYTLTLPANPSEGHRLTIVSNGTAITALTISANSGHTVASGALPTTFKFGAGNSVQFVFRSTVWYLDGGEMDGGVTATKVADYTASARDGVVLCDSSGGTFTVTLPAAAAAKGVILTVTKTDSSLTAVTIDGNGSETINGSTTTTLNTQYESVDLVSDGSNWLIRNRRIPSIWTSYTPATIGWTSNATASGYWRRVGDSIQVWCKVSFSGLPAGLTGNAKFSLPSSLVVDFTKQNSSATSYGNYTCTGSFADASSGTMYAIQALWADGSTPTLLEFALQVASGTYVNNGGPFSPTAPVTIASGDALWMSAQVPISGWNG